MRRFACIPCPTTRAVALLFLCFRLVAVSAFVKEHEVTQLPGWSQQLPSKHYSGYIPVGEPGHRRFLHYWLVLSERDPETDPVMLWLNGGPGTSSLFGLLTEIGQLGTNVDSFKHQSDDGVPALFYNDYTWSKVATMLFLESPAGVGFSYCEAANCTNTDESTADDTYDFLLEFFRLYPELAPPPFYIVGESYAGVYIPMATQRLLSRPNSINLQGIAIGNGCVGKDVGICADTTEASFRYALEFFRSHFMVSPPLYRALSAACNWSAPPTPPCWELIQELRGEMGVFNLYNVYDTCGAVEDIVSGSSGSGGSSRGDLLSYWHLAPSSNTLRLRSLGVAAGGELGGGALRNTMDTYTCGGENAMNAYLSHPQVAEALHVLPGPHSMKYVRTVGDLRPLMAWIIERIRVLIYSGDVDACVPTNDTEEWIQWVVARYKLPLRLGWSPWRAPTRGGAYLKAGYHQVYGPNNFTFATFNGAGHMVPTYKPAEALAFITRFLAGQELDQPPPPAPAAARHSSEQQPHRLPSRQQQQ